MKIGILGAGVVGKNLALGWCQKGHQIMFSSRDPQSEKMQALLEALPGDVEAGTVAGTIAFSEIIVLAVSWSAVRDVLTQHEDWTGKIIVDTTNRRGTIGDDEEATAAATVAKWAAGAKVVKAYNTVGAEHMSNPVFHNQIASMFICGDAAAREIVRPLIVDSGFDVVEVGDLDKADLLESLARLWITLAFEAGNGRDIAFKLLRK